MEGEHANMWQIPYKMEGEHGHMWQIPYKMEGEHAKMWQIPYKMEGEHAHVSEIPYKMEGEHAHMSEIPCKMEGEPAQMWQIPCKMTNSSSKPLQTLGKRYQPRNPKKTQTCSKKNPKTISQPYSLDLKNKPPDFQMRYLVCKMIRARLRIQRAFVLSGIEWIYQNGRVWIEGNVWAGIFESKNFVGGWTVYLCVFCNARSKVDKSYEG